MILIFLLSFVLSHFLKVHSVPFMDYKFELEHGNQITHASLTDKKSGNVWQIEEKISSNDLIEAKIQIIPSKTEEPFNVYYSFKPGYDSGKRIVMQDYNCDLFVYKSTWDKLPGVESPLINMLLLLGPSFFHRITDFTWTLKNDTIIRGAVMHSATTVIERKLKATIYWKNPDDVYIGVNRPQRIVITGYSPDAQDDEDVGDTAIMDIYLQSITYEQLSEFVQPKPGIGCSSYLQKNLPAPALSVQKFHFMAKDSLNGKPFSLKEIHVDEQAKVLRLSESRYGFTTTYIYDYNLGIRYTLATSDSCKIFPMDTKTIGIDVNGKFSVEALIWTADSFQYLGQVIFEHRSGYKAKVWESVQFNKQLESGRYDKVVTTSYLHPSVDDNYFSGYMIVAATRNAYNNDGTGKYQLIESTHRDFYDFDIDLLDDEYETAFDLGDCFEDSNKRLTLTLHLICDTGKKSNCTQESEEMTYYLRGALMDRIGRLHGLSPLRTTDIAFVFSESRIEVDLTLVEAPSLLDSLSYDYLAIDKNSVVKLHEFEAKSELDCLKLMSSYYEPGRAVVYCKNGDFCVSTDRPSNISPGASGSSYCKIYKIPLKNLNRLGKEKSLEELHDHLSFELVNSKFNLQDESGRKVVFEIADVVDSKKRSEEKEKALYEMVRAGFTLSPNGQNIIEVAGMNLYSECYRACSRSEDIFCEVFSFCHTKTSTTCILTSLNEKQVISNLTTDINCNVYSKSHITDYTGHPDKSYKVPTSESKTLWVDKCAAECAFAEDCHSFQTCEDNSCTFGGYYRESNTKFDRGCTIYTPKIIQKYQQTGSKIISSILHSETDLNLDQCSALCFDYNSENDQDECKSFNYCPKSSSSPASCQLTKYTISDVKVQTNESINCRNYQLKDDEKRRNNKDNSIVEQPMRITGLGAFGIIILFLTVGIITGIVIPYSLIKMRGSSIFRWPSNGFNWSRQIDATEPNEI